MTYEKPPSSLKMKEQDLDDSFSSSESEKSSKTSESGSSSSSQSDSSSSESSSSSSSSKKPNKKSKLDDLYEKVQNYNKNINNEKTKYKEPIKNDKKINKRSRSRSYS